MSILMALYERDCEKQQKNLGKTNWNWVGESSELKNKGRKLKLLMINWLGNPRKLKSISAAELNI